MSEYRSDAHEVYHNDELYIRVNTPQEATMVTARLNFLTHQLQMREQRAEAAEAERDKFFRQLTDMEAQKISLEAELYAERASTQKHLGNAYEIEVGHEAKIAKLQAENARLKAQNARMVEFLEDVTALNIYQAQYLPSRTWNFLHHVIKNPTAYRWLVTGDCDDVCEYIDELDVLIDKINTYEFDGTMKSAYVSKFNPATYEYDKVGEIVFDEDKVLVRKLLVPTYSA